MRRIVILSMVLVTAISLMAMAPAVQSDLGDAPDSTNHHGVGMAAYPGVPARFPTVFDPALPGPSGPKHKHAWPFHLGDLVDPEAEADVGAGRNLNPPANQANLDNADDGVDPALINFNLCLTTTIDVKVYITPNTVNYFEQHGGKGYLNIWVDGNQDGDWDDVYWCDQQAPAIEHIVRDFPVDVGMLGAGVHIINVATDLVPWTIGENDLAWLRVTLSDKPAPKPFSVNGIPYGDGRGPNAAYELGETEDYLLNGNNPIPNDDNNG